MPNVPPPTDGPCAGDPAAAEDERLERVLRAQQPYAVPLGLVSSVLQAIRHEPSHRQARVLATPSRTGWAVAAVLLLAIGSYLTLGGPDLLAGVPPVSPLGSGDGQAALAAVAALTDEDAVQTGIDNVVGNFTSVSAVVEASQSAVGDPRLWLPIAFASILAGLTLARRLAIRHAHRTEPTSCAS